MLCKSWKDWLLKNRQNVACKIFHVQLQNSIACSVFNGFQESWSQSLCLDLLYAKQKKFWKLSKNLLLYCWSNARPFLGHLVLNKESELNRKFQFWSILSNETLFISNMYFNQFTAILVCSQNNDTSVNIQMFNPIFCCLRLRLNTYYKLIRSSVVVNFSFALTVFYVLQYGSIKYNCYNCW